MDYHEKWRTKLQKLDITRHDLQRQIRAKKMNYDDNDDNKQIETQGIQYYNDDFDEEEQQQQLDDNLPESTASPEASTTAALNTTAISDVGTILVENQVPISNEFRNMLETNKSLKHFKNYYLKEVTSIAELLFCHKAIRGLVKDDDPANLPQQMQYLYNAAEGCMYISLHFNLFLSIFLYL